MSKSKVVVFDLDDTLINEIEYLTSAYLEIANFLNGGHELHTSMLKNFIDKKNVFTILIDKYKHINLTELLNIYRSHFPENLSVREGVAELMGYLKDESIAIGLISDVRSLTQRNKLAATGLLSYFDLIVISEEFGSEKPDPANYVLFMDTYKAEEYYYIGDNFNKDFYAPNILGWTTIGVLNSGNNIHSQNHNQSSDYLPKFLVDNLLEVKSIIAYQL